MRGGDQDASAFGFGVSVFFEAFVADIAMDVIAVQLGEAGYAVDDAAQGLEDSVGDLGRVGVAREFQVAKGNASETGDRVVKRAGGNGAENAHSIQPPP